MNRIAAAPHPNVSLKNGYRNGPCPRTGLFQLYISPNQFSFWNTLQISIVMSDIPYHLFHWFPSLLTFQPNGLSTLVLYKTIYLFNFATMTVPIWIRYFFYWFGLNNVRSHFNFRQTPRVFESNHILKHWKIFILNVSCSLTGHLQINAYFHV